MPIRPEWRHLYRCQEWRDTRARILARAGDCCEQCGKPNGRTIYTYTWQSWRLEGGGKHKLYQMVWLDAEHGKRWRDQGGLRIPKWLWPAPGLPRRIRVQLGVAHVDGNPANRQESNLRAWCTWCHLHHDMAQHSETRGRRKDQDRPLCSNQGLA